MTGPLRVSDGEGHRLLTLDRPDKGNALSEDLASALDAACAQAVADDVPLLVLAGEGRHFCTGFDLADLEERSDGDLLARFVRIEMMLDRLWQLPVPTLAIAKGRTMGAGADIFVACQRRVAIEGASFAFPGVNFGLVLGTRRLGARIGDGPAADILLGGRQVATEEAAMLGLVQQVIAPGEEAAAIAAEAALAARLPPVTGRALRAVLSGPADADGDLARLVRSAAPRGLRERIMAYRAGLKTKTSAAPAQS